MHLYELALVAAGGWLGTVARAAAGRRMNRRFPSALPYGTLAVNLLGSLGLGWLLGAHLPVYALAGVGFLGALTTFSTMVMEFRRLLVERERLRLTIYAVATWFGGLGAVWLGVRLATGGWL